MTADAWCDNCGEHVDVCGGCLEGPCDNCGGDPDTCDCDES